MAMRDVLLSEFDQEMATTQRVLAAVPEAQTSFRPHEKSWTLGELSLHVVNVMTWLPMTMSTTELDLAPPGGPKWKSPVFESAAATLRLFESVRQDARSALAVASDQDLAVRWTLLVAARPLFTRPRVECLRTFVMNHHIHHRGQLTVYLRASGAKVPSVYGPTADEPMPGV